MDDNITVERRQWLAANGRSFLFRGERVALDTTGRYGDGSQAVQLVGWDGEPWATLSVRLVDTPVPHPSYVWVKTWSENEEIAGAALRAGLFHDSGRIAPAGYAVAELWSLNPDWNQRMAVRALGIDDNAFDTAIPQGFMDELRAFAKEHLDGWEPFGQLMWDERSLFGQPFPLTPEANDAIALFKQSKEAR